MPRDVCLIVNPRAGGGRAERKLPAVEAALRHRELPFRTVRTRSLDHARQLAHEARERGEIVAAMGGDGVTGAIAHELRGTDAVLAVIPGGRGNDFARKLGIGEGPEAAVAVLAHDVVRSVDVADADGLTVLGIASAGFDSDVQVIANATRLPLGNAVYLYSTLRALGPWRTALWKVTVDGTRHEFAGYSVSVANSGLYGGGMRYVPEASMTDGLLDVVLLAAIGKVELLRVLPRVFRGTHVDHPALTFLRGREVTFEADRPFTLFADGDPVSELPSTVRVVPGALRVLAP